VVPVGVDRNRNGSVCPVRDRGALVYAWPPAIVPLARQDDMGAGRLQDRRKAKRDVEVVSRLGVAGRHGGPGRVAGFLQDSRVDQPVDLRGMAPVLPIVSWIDRDHAAV
jgi:hypothetical protein